MSGNGVPEDVPALLRKHVESIEQLELLALLREHPDERWSLAALMARLQLPEPTVRAALQRLCTLGLFAADHGSGDYSYRPASDQLASDADRLVQLYTSERAAVLRILSAHAIQRLRAGALSAFSAGKLEPAAKKEPAKQGDEP